VSRHSFVGIDGEGHGNELVLLAANTADGKGQTYVENYDGGLTTVEMMEWLWNLKDLYPHHRFVGFSFTYDVNMILHPILWNRPTMLRRLVDRKVLTVRLTDTTNLMIRFYPTKFVVFTETTGIGKNKVIGRSIRIEDTFGFYQQSFVKALKTWDMPDLKALERIEEGKKHRSSEFAEMDSEQVRAYCLDECEQLASLTTKLSNAIDSAGIQLQKYIGAGSIAQTFMTKYRVDYHVTHDAVYGKDIQDAILYGYFGGRSEIFRQGYFRNGAHVYDINSAYPAQTLQLPSLRKASWRRYNGTHDTLSKALDEIRYGLCRVSWDMYEHCPFIVPFPKRMPNGNIRYQSKGEGWYWISEAKAAIRHFPDNVTIHEILALEAKCSIRPFQFVEQLAALRLQAKQNDLPSNKIYKLGLNSLYGKTAQATRGNRTPQFQSYVWAGMITAGTRAQLLDVIAPNQDKVIACATDGVIFASDVDVQCGNGLGEWEHKTYSELLYLQAGVYFCDGFGINKTRGHILSDLHYEQILQGWLDYGPNFEYNYTSRRFVGMGLANHLNDFGMWCQWIDFPRTLRCRPPGKINFEAKPTYFDHMEYTHTQETYQLHNMVMVKSPVHSTKFDRHIRIPTNTLDRNMLDLLVAKEQPNVPTLF
jgi:DNA polymerase family B